MCKAIAFDSDEKTKTSHYVINYFIFNIFLKCFMENPSLNADYKSHKVGEKISLGDY